MATIKSSPKIQRSAIQQQRAALRSAATLTSKPVSKKKIVVGNNISLSSTGASSGNRSSWRVDCSLNFYPSFLVDSTNERSQEEYEFEKDDTNADIFDDTPKSETRKSIISTFNSATTTPKNNFLSNSTIGSTMRELLKVRSSREGKLLRLNASSYSYKCSRFMNGDPRTKADHHVDVTLLGSFSFDTMSQVSTIIGYVHKSKEVANFSFTSESIQALKLQHGSQLRIYDCLRLQTSVTTYICTSLAEPHPSGLPEVPPLDSIPLPTVT